VSIKKITFGHVNGLLHGAIFISVIFSEYEIVLLYVYQKIPYGYDVRPPFRLGMVSPLHHQAPRQYWAQMLSPNGLCSMIWGQERYDDAWAFWYYLHHWYDSPLPTSKRHINNLLARREPLDSVSFNDRPPLAQIWRTRAVGINVTHCLADILVHLVIMHQTQ